ncbi:SRPBCC family protein [Patulibacter americanus]|uniref:SRPBCC family protein n=1 Tax=Patulibacter americanus TaxID=588672 RepID=UPI0003B6E707|nr:SRPBCC family protein [Patulibacter americanus]
MLITASDTTVPVTVQGRTSVPPETAFDVVVPIDLSLIFTGWRGIFPGVRGSKNETGPWDHVGASRNPDLADGSTATETLAEYTRPSSFAYTLVDFTNVLGRLVGGVRGEWTFAPDGTGTLIRWTYEFKPLPGRTVIMRRIVGPLWRRYMAQALRATIEVAERTPSEASSTGTPQDDVQPARSAAA